MAMDIDTAKAWIKTQVPPAAQKLVVAYALQLAVANELRQQALKSGASEASLNAIQGMVPLAAAQLFA